MVQIGLNKCTKLAWSFLIFHFPNDWQSDAFLPCVCEPMEFHHSLPPWQCSSWHFPRHSFLFVTFWVLNYCLCLCLIGKDCHLKMFTTTAAQTTGRIMWCPLRSVLTEKMIFTSLLTATHIHILASSITSTASKKETWIISSGSSLDRVW